MTHNIKIKEKYYSDIVSEQKTFELRKNDRNYQVGDLIKFQVLKENSKIIDTDTPLYVITYILKDVPEYGLDKNYCIFGIKKYHEPNSYYFQCVGFDPLIRFGRKQSYDLEDFELKYAGVFPKIVNALIKNLDNQSFDSMMTHLEIRHRNVILTYHISKICFFNGCKNFLYFLKEQNFIEKEDKKLIQNLIKKPIESEISFIFDKYEKQIAFLEFTDKETGITDKLVRAILDDLESAYEHHCGWY